MVIIIITMGIMFMGIMAMGTGCLNAHEMNCNDTRKCKELSRISSQNGFKPLVSGSLSMNL